MIQIILMTALGACLYRWRGHASKYKRFFPRPFNQIAFAMAYAFACFPPATDHWYIPAIVLILTTLAVLTGHGGFMDLGSYKPDRKDETLEFIIKPLRGKLPEYWYDALGLAITGLAVTLHAGLTTLNPLLALSGALKAPAYMIGHALHKNGERATALGEWLTGAFLYGALAWLCL